MRWKWRVQMPWLGLTRKWGFKWRGLQLRHNNLGLLFAILSISGCINTKDYQELVKANPNTPLTFDQFIDNSPGKEYSVGKYTERYYRARKEDPLVAPQKLTYAVYYEGFKQNFKDWCQSNKGSVVTTSEFSAVCAKPNLQEVFGAYEYEIARPPPNRWYQYGASYVIYRYKRQAELGAEVQKAQDREWESYLAASKEDFDRQLHLPKAVVGNLMCFKQYASTQEVIVGGVIQKVDIPKIDIQIKAIGHLFDEGPRLSFYTSLTSGGIYRIGDRLTVNQKTWTPCETLLIN